MGTLSNPQWEQFAQKLVKGTPARVAYREVGYKGDGHNASALVSKPAIAARVEELSSRVMRLEEESMEQAIQRAALTKYDVLMELKSMAFGNIADFFEKDAKGEVVLRDGWPVLDMSCADEHQLKAVKEIVVEEYTDGFGEDAREVKKTRVILHDKRGPLIDIARMMGMVKPASIQFNQNNLQQNINITLSEDELLASR